MPATWTFTRLSIRSHRLSGGEASPENLTFAGWPRTKRMGAALNSEIQVGFHEKQFQSRSKASSRLV